MTTDDLEKLLAEATPGPWFAVRPDHYHGWWVVLCDQGGFDCVDASGDGGFDEQTARLIALAPDLARKVIAAEKMVEALRHLSGTYDCSDVTGPALAAWEAAQ